MISAAIVLFFHFDDDFTRLCLQRFDYQKFGFIGSTSNLSVSSLYTDVGKIIFPCEFFEEYIISKEVVMVRKIVQDWQQIERHDSPKYKMQLCADKPNRSKDYCEYGQFDGAET